MKAIEKFPGDTGLVLGAARIYEMLNDMDQALVFHKKALKLGVPSSVGRFDAVIKSLDGVVVI